MPSEHSNQMVERLLDVAIVHFGAHGFQGSATRDIARDAQTLMSSITYHFRGKEGLYLAAADRVAMRVGDLLTPALEEAATVYGSGGTTRARAALHVLARCIVEVMVGPEHEALARFIMRERADSSEAFQRIYKGTMQDLLECWIELLRCVCARPMSGEEAYLRTHAMIGQILVFRTARGPVSTGLAWAVVGAREIEAVQAVVAEHLDAVLDRLGACPNA